MTDARNSAIEYAHQNQGRFLEELIELISIPSVSTDPEQKPQMQCAAEWLSTKLTSLGMHAVAIYPTLGQPIVFAEYLGAGTSAPTVLVYGHYDVQPAEPLDLWETPPFTPSQRGNNLYGRGVSDMKGQIMATLSAIESIQRNHPFPVNLKFLLEGEEEIGSPNLAGFIREHQALLKADVCLNPDAGMVSKELPAIVYALRGLAYFELRIFGPQHDLHSGIFGGVIHNPAQVICDLIAGMHDVQGRVTLPGFYDPVRPLEIEERSELARLPVTEATYLQQTGAPALWGESGYTPVERVGARPTLEINGLLSGFTGIGSKTVIPAWAMAKISMRLVPDQDPKLVEEQLRRYLEEHAPNTVRWELARFSGGKASISPRNTRATQALTRALETVWGVRPAFKREGGSIPVTVDMQQILGINSVLTGFGLPDDNFHAPNEKLDLPTWYRGIDALIHFFYNL
ncbi:MAG: dipeptidase [Anaerolineaceae bacterium]|nr:dipeptidase [Anaerolineaceae bacterium]